MDSQALARWLPGLAALRRYDPAWLPRDIAAGLSVAAIALPVGIAYAELAGAPAAVGIYAAIFPLVPYALLGSSRQLVLGPDAATCIMVAASLAPLAHGDPARFLALMPVLTLITGALYLLAAMGRLGFFASFLSQPILTGYLNGVAIVIIVGQLPKLLGYPSAAGEVLPRLLTPSGDHGDLYTVRETVLRYLPETLANYVALPPAFRSAHVLRDGKTARQLLTEQIALLDARMQDIVANVASADAQALLANGEFLRMKFDSADFLPR